MTDAISVRELTKSFGDVRALDRLELTVRTGEVHGFLGPNGAGKSTAIRVLLGLLRRDSGEVSLLGGDPWRDAVVLHRRLAYVPGDVNLWGNLSGGEAIDLFGSLRGGLDHARRDELIRRFQLDPTKLCRTYSKGNRQKVALVAAFASDVELYILDEPTSGLDPLMEAVFTECVGAAKERGRTVLLSSHILAEVEKLCDGVSIIRDGHTVESGTLTELRHLTRTTMTVRTERPLTGLDRLEGVHDLRADADGDTGGDTGGDGTRASFEVESDALAEVHRYLAELGVRDLTSHPPTLEDLFMRHYDGQAGDTAGTERLR